MTFKEKLGDLIAAMRECADEAGAKLENKNLSDIILLGVARLEQAAAHVDIDRMDANEDQRNMPFPGAGGTSGELQSGGNALFAAGDPGVSLANEEAQRRAALEAQGVVALPKPFPGAVLDPDAKHPGDPSFRNPNKDFKSPEVVNLNDDGTLKQAPNTLGTSDDRSGKKEGGE